jgi:hypothetical protein
MALGPCGPGRSFRADLGRHRRPKLAKMADFATPLRDQLGSISPGHKSLAGTVLPGMVKFLLWLILLVLSWPLALLALVLYPFVWILLLPFRLAGIVVDGVFEFLRAIVRLPGRALGGRS